mmetsp:Transcript_19857/g.39940  ORF Transcript_19857/g.39940 Transcript_19857/m.39940 type:complete len:207 (+) Transcript_19857:487-1107(+)
MRAVSNESGMWSPESQNTGGSPCDAQPSYCACLFWKCAIQLPRGFMVAGARRAQAGGRNPFSREDPSSSNSALIPISPASALLRSNRDEVILLIRIWNLATSCTSTTSVGLGTWPSSLWVFISSVGILLRTSEATCRMYSSLLMPPDPPPSDVCMFNTPSQSCFAASVKYPISAFGCSPKTSGEDVSGSSAMDSLYLSIASTWGMM